MMTKKTSFGPYTIALIVLVSLRGLGQLVQAFYFTDFAFFYIVISGIYFASLYGIVTKKTWGSLMAISIVALDLILALMFISSLPLPTLIGAIITNLVIAFLAYKEYVLVKHVHKKAFRY